MNLTKNYRGKITPIGDLQLKPYSEGVVFRCGYYNIESAYTFILNPQQYLATAKKAVLELSKLSGMDYRIYAKHPEGAVWREL